ncbi:trypsin-like peptidase domain-containing protein [Ottowia thiooxydans]|uniref:trypsin-like peptidase domain-containing protein n=1 Tax=Ottowia thiooxydans TaxID=219182 RepID=UPI0004065979|nr:trypsin-like peptidase domain-containing protein [Ottowia thiooxydans]
MRPKSAIADSSVVRLSTFEKSTNASAKEGAISIGSARNVEATMQPQEFQARLSWQSGPDGKKTASLTIESPAAQGIRLGLQIHMLPMRSVVRVFGSQDDRAVEIDSSILAQTVQNNLNAGTPEQEARLYWLPTVKGPRVTLEIDLPADIPRSALVLSVPQLVHFWRLPEDADPDMNITKAATASCHVDASCSREFDTAAKSVARMSYIDAGAAYYCSGALIADSAGTRTPYFLSAAHCISTQAVASTLETTWFYRSASCGSSVVNSQVRHLVGGASLLFVNGSTDTVLLRLNSTPPDGVYFAEWDATPPQRLDSVTGIHHPGGDLLKISEGYLKDFLICTATSMGVSCTESNVSTGKFLNINWLSGTTEGGSSGSPLFKEKNGKQYVIGQLQSLTRNICALTRSSQYGRFDLAYEAGLKRWLGAANSSTPEGKLTPVFRFFNPSTGAHFYTNSVLERDFVMATYPVFIYEGPRFKAFSQTGPSLAPVYRFFNVQTGAHFYSISPGERDFVLTTYPQFKYEGPAWYAQPQAGNNAEEVYRFFHLKNGVHFYTASKAESDFVRATYPEWKFEGGAYYAWPN